MSKSLFSRISSATLLQQRRANKAITVFKSVYPEESMPFYRRIGAEFYSKTELYGFSTNELVTDHRWGQGIEEMRPFVLFGYRSFDNPVHALHFQQENDYNVVLCKFQIPKGARYYHNKETHEYISESIICVGKYPLYRSLLDGVLFLFQLNFKKPKFQFSYDTNKIQVFFKTILD